MCLGGPGPGTDQRYAAVRPIENYSIAFIQNGLRVSNIWIRDVVLLSIRPRHVPYHVPTVSIPPLTEVGS